MSSALPVSGWVQRVVENDRVSWTVIGADRRPVEPVDAFLRWLTDTERSPNTVRAYTGDLRQFWEFLEVRGYDWTKLGVEELEDFASWLRTPADNVVVLPRGVPARGASTVNRKLAAVGAFYDFHHRQSGVPVAERLHPPWNRSGRGSFKPMLQAFAPLRAGGRPGRLPERRRLPQGLALSQVEAVLRSQRRVRDRFLFAVPFQTGMRVGQALGLRHEDVVRSENRIEIVSREDNANGARGKGGAPRENLIHAGGSPVALLAVVLVCGVIILLGGSTTQARQNRATATSPPEFISLVPACACGRSTVLAAFSLRTGRRLRTITRVTTTSGQSVSLTGGPSGSLSRPRQRAPAAPPAWQAAARSPTRAGAGD